MTPDPDTIFERAAQIALIRQRFEAALRAGETIDGLGAWLQHVPEHIRPQLREQLEKSRKEVSAGSVETQVLTSDAALGWGANLDNLFLTEEVEDDHAVQGCQTFQGLSKAARNALQERLVPKPFSTGTELLRQGENARGLHLILRGSVDIVDTKTGERIDCDGAGSVLGEMSLLTGQPCSATVIATSDVEALVLSNEDYAELKSQHPELEIALSQLVSDRLGGRRHDALCGKNIGEYQLTRCINRGGMGVVYEAREARTGGESVALKMLRHRFIYDDHMQSRFDQEAKLLENLRHANIVSLRDHFLAYRTRFLVLDLCDGSDLFRVLAAKGPLDEGLVRAILGQIAEGLLYAHESGVIHRDLKPGNVLVDRRGQVKLTDFGLSKLLESEVLEGKAVGTPAYMPPEQFQSESVGHECDWYSLGCLICEMLTGNILFQGRNWMEMFELKRNKKPSYDWPEIDSSSELRAIIHGALQPKVRDRTLDLEVISRWADNVEGLFGDQDPDLPIQE
jgi:CRP-like cAMP-binding protein